MSRKQNKSRRPSSVPKTSGENKENLQELELPNELKSVVELVPKEKQKVATERLVSIISQSYHGPLPPANELARYEEIVPGFANRIVKLAEEEAIHRRNLENTIVRRQLNQSSAGQWLGSILSVILIGVGGFLTYNGHDTVGGVIFGTTIVGLAIVFITGRASKKSEGENNS